MISAIAGKLKHAAFCVVIVAILFVPIDDCVLADGVASPYSFDIDAEVQDSFDIEYNMMMERYRSLNLDRSEEILTYSGSTLWDYMTDIKLDDTIMYALDVNGLRVFDISTPETPVLLDDFHLPFGSTLNMMFLQGNHLFIARADRVLILDISDPLAPVQISSIALGETIMQVEVVDDRLYAGVLRYGGDYGQTPALYILDISDLSSPRIVGKYHSPSSYNDARKFLVMGSLIYTLNHWSGRLEVIDISDETRPERISYVDIEAPLGIAHRNGYLYVIGYDLNVVDLSLPEAPVLIHTYDTKYGTSVAIHNDMLYFMEYSDPLTHAYGFTGNWGIDSLGTHKSRGRHYSLVFQDNIMYIPEGLWGMSVADITGPTYMPRVGEFNHDCSTLRGIDLKNDVAYATNYMSYFTGDSSMRRNGIYVVDVSDEEEPEFIKHVYIAGNTADALVHDSLLIISTCPRTNIYSLNDPLDPTYLGRYLDDYRYTHSNEARGSALYVCGSGWGFEIGSIADPANPTFLSNIKGEGEDRYTRSAIIRQNLAYVFDGADNGGEDATRMMVVDVSNPYDPEIVEDFLISSDVWYVWGGHETVAKGDYFYNACGDRGLYVLDVSNPILPDIAASYTPDAAGYYYPVYRRDYLFVSARNSIEVFDISDPLNPTLIQFVPMSSSPGKMKVDGNYLHAACAGGYYIFNINVPPVECGDANADGSVDIDDAVWMISYIFAGGPPPDSPEVGDVNCSGGVDIDDVVYLIMYIFAGGPDPCSGC